MSGAGDAKALVGGEVTVLEGGAAKPLGCVEAMLLVLGAGEIELKPTRSLRLGP